MYNYIWYFYSTIVIYTYLYIYIDIWHCICIYHINRNEQHAIISVFKAGFVKNPSILVILFTAQTDMTRVRVDLWLIFEKHPNGLKRKYCLVCVYISMCWFTLLLMTITRRKRKSMLVLVLEFFYGKQKWSWNGLRNELLTYRRHDSA